MRTSLRTTTITATMLVATGLAGALPAEAADRDNGPALHAPVAAAPPTPCTALAARYFDVVIDDAGNGNISVGDDGVNTCNESVVLWSLANSSAAIDNHEPIVDQFVVQVHELEAAGAAGIDFTLQLDPCWSGFQVLRDGDTLVHQEMMGDGCEMIVDTDFTGASSNAEIHVVQQTGVIAPPHMWNVTGDDTTLLTGMPSGTWYVKVFDGFIPGSSLASAATGSTGTNTLHSVPHGSTVDITIVDPLGLAQVSSGRTSSAKRAICSSAFL